MKKIFMIMLMAWNGAAFAQVDSTKTATDSTQAVVDTIRVGNILIIKKPNEKNSKIEWGPSSSVKKKKKYTTNWWMIDIGYSGLNDITDYASTEARAFMPTAGSTPINAGDFSLRNTRISNFSLWIFMRKHNIAANVINVKYGFGIESNNYFYKTPLTYVDGANPTVKRDNVTFSKNKLVANYLTVPIMLNINTTPNSTRKGLQFSAGISTGVLYKSHQKQESEERGKTKQKTDFNLNRFKLAMIGELGVGPFKFYGSYALTPLHRYGVDQLPYNVGIRLGNL